MINHWGDQKNTSINAEIVLLSGKMQCNKDVSFLELVFKFNVYQQVCFVYVEIKFHG